MHTRVGLAAVVLGSMFFGCRGDDVSTISGSTIRVGKPVTKGQTGPFALQIFDTEEDCGQADSIVDAERDACLPFVDRATGTVRLAYQLRVDGNAAPMSLRPDAITVLHNESKPSGKDEARVSIIPHQPSATGNLYILLIDGSGSMAIVDRPEDGLTRMDKLRTALLRRDVVDAFFGGDGAASEVALVVFRGESREPLGGTWVVGDPDEYRRLIRDELQVGSGYTFLYQAVQYGAIGIAEVPELRAAIENRGLAPTVIALTDGFNNERPSDVCADNAPRLATLLERLQDVRLGRGGRGYQPEIFTVGLGKRAWRSFKVPEGLSVAPAQLCGGFGQYPINGGVEERGVDNAALAWIAKVGNGESYVEKDAAGLAEAFKAAAQKRYMWFEVRYRVDPFHLRRGFDVTIRLTQPYQVEATVPIYPNAWVDGPPGIAGADGWPAPAPFRATIVVLVAVLSLVAAWTYLPAAVFNVRRALFGIVARPHRRKG
ncbi:MAG: VWA domain-containing protein [Myxococcales bacterium]|nr:VWA domain-containing protein [Myxococcales bacterium]